MQLENGTYPARPTEYIDVGTHKNGCLVANVEFVLQDGQKIIKTFWLAKANGEPHIKIINGVKKVFGWDGLDPYWLMDNKAALAEIDVELVIENKTFIGTRDGLEHTVSEIAWVNLPGENIGGAEIANRDRKTVLAKYGARLRAINGGVAVPQKKAASQPSASPSTPPTAPPVQAPVPKNKTFPPSGMNECWKAINDTMKKDNKTREEIENKWLEIVRKVHGDKEQISYDASDWGAIMAHLKAAFDNLPF